MNFWLLGLLVLLGTTIADACWAFYIANIANGSKWRASLAAFAILLVQGFVVVEYVKDSKLIPFAGAGAFLGTMLSMTYQEHKDKKHV